jgi:hypothetical protein
LRGGRRRRRRESRGRLFRRAQPAKAAVVDDAANENKDDRAAHAKDGGGINGVNLTDDHYKNVKKVPDFFTVITNGANNGAMPAWRTNFSDNERVLLAAYVMNLRGTKPASARPPEGEVLPPFPKPTK